MFFFSFLKKKSCAACLPGCCSLSHFHSLLWPSYLQPTVIAPTISMPGFSFISLSLSCSGSKQTKVYHTETIPGTLRSKIPTVAALTPQPPLISECRLNQEIRTDQPSALCGLLFILHFLITLPQGSFSVPVLCLSRAEFHSHIDVNKSQMFKHKII